MIYLQGKASVIARGRQKYDNATVLAGWMPTERELASFVAHQPSIDGSSNLSSLSFQSIIGCQLNVQVP